MFFKIPKRDENPIVSFFLHLAHSQKYINFKLKVRDLLQNDKNKIKKYIDYTLVFLIVTSVGIFIYDLDDRQPLNRSLNF